MTDIIDLFKHNHKECVALLTSLQNYYKSDKSALFESIVESIFARMFSLNNESKIIYYAILLVNLCKFEMTLFPPALGRAITTIFNRLDLNGGGMDIECVGRFSDWFAIHLSNYRFIWKWKEWYFNFIQGIRDGIDSIFG